MAGSRRSNPASSHCRACPLLRDRQALSNVPFVVCGWHVSACLWSGRFCVQTMQPFMAFVPPEDGKPSARKPISFGLLEKPTKTRLVLGSFSAIFELSDSCGRGAIVLTAKWRSELSVSFASQPIPTDISTRLWHRQLKWEKQDFPVAQQRFVLRLTSDP